MKSLINKIMFILVMAFVIIFSYHGIEKNVKAYSYKELLEYIQSFSIRDFFDQE